MLLPLSKLIVTLQLWLMPTKEAAVKESYNDGKMKMAGEKMMTVAIMVSSMLKSFRDRTNFVECVERLMFPAKKCWRLNKYER